MVTVDVIKVYETENHVVIKSLSQNVKDQFSRRCPVEVPNKKDLLIAFKGF